MLPIAAVTERKKHIQSVLKQLQEKEVIATRRQARTEVNVRLGPNNLAIRPSVVHP